MSNKSLPIVNFSYTEKEIYMLFELYISKAFEIYKNYKSNEDELNKRIIDISTEIRLFSNDYKCFTELWGYCKNYRFLPVKWHLYAEHMKLYMKCLTNDEFNEKYPAFKNLYPSKYNTVDTFDFMDKFIAALEFSEEMENTFLEENGVIPEYQKDVIKGGMYSEDD